MFSVNKTASRDEIANDLRGLAKKLLEVCDPGDTISVNLALKIHESDFDWTQEIQ